MTQKPCYTFVAYKPNSEDYDYACGCCVERYNSGHHMLALLDEDSLIDAWARVMLENLELGYNEEPYEVWILQHGIPVWEDDGFVFNEEYWSTFQHTHSPFPGATALAAVKQQLQEHLCEMNERAAEYAGLWLKTKQEREAAAKQQKQQEELAKEKGKRLQQFNELLKEFGDLHINKPG